MGDVFSVIITWLAGLVGSSCVFVAFSLNLQSVRDPSSIKPYQVLARTRSKLLRFYLSGIWSLDRFLDAGILYYVFF